MDMIDQYLEAVAAQLPLAERDDIIAELRDLILSSFEAKESGLQRPLNDEERLEILREIGHPLVVAARYRKGPDALIGPELFPYWLFAVKTGLMVLAVTFTIGLVGSFLSDPLHISRELFQVVHAYVWAGLQLVGVTTLVGAILEHNRIKPRWMTQWRIADLKAFSLADPAKWGSAHWGGSGWGSAKWTKPVGGAASVLRRTLPGKDHVVSLVANSIFLLWWTGLLQFDALTHLRWRHEDILVTGAPIWTALYEIILVYVVAHIAADLMGLIRPYAVRTQGALEALLACAGLGILYTVFQAGHWFTLTQGAQSAPIQSGPFIFGRHAFAGLDGIDKASASLSMTMTWGMVVIAIITLSRLVRGLRKLASSPAAD